MACMTVHMKENHNMVMTDTDLIDITMLMHAHHGERVRWPETFDNPMEARTRITSALASTGKTAREAIEVSFPKPDARPLPADAAILWR